MSNNAVVKFEATLAQVMPKVRAGFPMSIPDDKLQRATDRLMFAIKASATANAKIYDCTASSVANCICLSALTGLLPGGAVPVVDLIPRQRSFKGPRGWQKVMELNWQIGWRGYKALGEKLGAVLEPRLVFKTDKYDVRFGLNPDLVHVPDLDGDRTWENLRGAYIIVRLPNGHVSFTDLTKAEIEKRRAVSQAWQYDQKDNKSASPWSQWPLEMALKTIVSYAARRGLFPIDEEFTMALDLDGREAPDNVLVFDAEAEEVKEPKAEPKSIASSTGMGALDSVLKAAPLPEPIPVDFSEQSPPERKPEPEEPQTPAGYNGPQPSSAPGLALGGGSPSGVSQASIAAAEQRIPEQSVFSIRKQLGIRKNARVESMDEDVKTTYLDWLESEYAELHPG
tara:strand:- start:1878 stop:3065 length:1188 start_codon:yes stop_codon:yes gene_type:complete